MNGSEFQQIWKAITDIQKRLDVLEESVKQELSEEDEESAINAINDNYGGE